MCAASNAKIQVALIGCSHRTAPVELRERVAFTQQQALEAADELRRRRILDEAVVVSTCNRSELYGVPGNEGGIVTEAMEAFLIDYHRLPSAALDGKLYRWIGSEAVRHLCRVTSGLDSMLLGEAEILAQVKAAYGQALDHGSTGPVLNRAFQGALEVGKRVRAETEVGARPVSVALAGVKLAERVFGNLKGHTALIVGAGTVAEQVVEHLRSRNIGRVTVVNRSFERGAELASRMRAETVAWDSLEKTLSAPDIIVTSVSGNEAVLTRSMLERAIDARKGRPVFLIDLGVPRNVAPDAAGLYSLYLYDIDDLGEIVEQNKKAREAEIPRAEALIAEQIAKFESWCAGLAAGSIVDELRVHFHRQREQLLREHAAANSNLSSEEHARMVRLTEELINRVLVTPTEQMRNGRGMRGRLGALEALRHLWGLDDPNREGKQ
jgi:glutamyl-tRNA reductase